MKKTLLFMALLVALSSCKKGNNNHFINGEIKGLGSTPVYLVSGSANSPVIDTLKAKNGVLAFDKAPSEPELYTLILPDNKSVTFYADEDSRLTFSGDISSSSSIMIDGDSVNIKLSAYRKSIQPEMEALAKAKQQADKAWSSDSLKRYEELLYSAQMQSVKKTWAQKTEQFIGKNRTSPAAVIALRDYYVQTSDLVTLQKLIPRIDAIELKEFLPHSELKTAGKLPLKKGFAMLSFQAYNSELKQDYFYPASGKKTVVLFWQSDDKYSAYLNKKLSGQFEKAKKDSVNYIAVSLDNSAEEWKAAVAKGGYKGKQIIVRGGFQNDNISKAGINRTPVLLVMDKGGKVTSVCENNENPLK
ncbi:thioredoxin-like domain-containing protein [Parabacteroides sp. FAFU027]|uniref:thioredoxin-like domain-containing protein n=1 Tax=Parabacteroides sp. FAFU027 TaxID=2922715 RepID=UPI001FAFD9C6|nr:thioredoxin-like domain-containing protein [Parabacteroides sp. FAFU027]